MGSLPSKEQLLERMAKFAGHKGSEEKIKQLYKDMKSKPWWCVGRLVVWSSHRLSTSSPHLIASP